MRWGEVTALRCCDMAEDESRLRVDVAHTEVVGRVVPGTLGARVQLTAGSC